jgi:WD40 repeat protein
VSGSNDKTLWLWDAINGAHLVTLRGHSRKVNSVAFSPDGTRIASGSDDKTLRIWDAVGGTHLIILRGYPQRITSVTFSPDGTRILSRSSDSLQLWDAVSGAHLVTHPSSVHSVAFSPDSTRIVSGSQDGILQLWDAVSGAPLSTMQGHPLYVSPPARSFSSSWTSFPGQDVIPSESTGPIFSYLTEDGWIYSMTLKRRICWVPRLFRPCALDVTRDSVVLGTNDGGVVILRFNNLDNVF